MDLKTEGASNPEVASSPNAADASSPDSNSGTAPQHRAFIILALAASAIAFFFGTGLHPLWWLTWLAPLAGAPHRSTRLPLEIMGHRLRGFYPWSPQRVD